MRRNRTTGTLLLILLLVMTAVLGACGSSGDKAEPSGTAAGSPKDNAQGEGDAADGDDAANEPKDDKPAELFKVKQMTNWFAQAEHGGQYAALLKGFYKEAGLDMTIESGGPGISSTQIVASGKADFGMGQGDEVLFARQNGIPLVALVGVFQKNPQAIMYHKGQDIKGFEDLDGRKAYVGSGVAYWEFMKKAFDLGKVQEFAYNGSLASFIEDDTAVSQSYMTSEPYTLAQEGIEVDFLLNADSGYAPYGNILYTTEKFLKDHPDIVKAYVEASVRGWNYYKDNYEEVNVFIKDFNPDMPLDKLEYSATALQPLVYGFDAETNGVGYMSEERWQTLMEQLLDLGLLESPIDVKTVFTTEFLPKP
ncbi:myristoyl transferase [Paenibacillaceae bacterium]|nr:myristoyl transferase [Paenibacillaceae bacterium]